LRSLERWRRALIEALEPRQLLSVNVLTWHYDAARSSLNSNEQSLTPANVNSSSFGELLSYPVTGQVYAQPLYVSNLAIPGQGTHNVVFVETMTNDVYAFDANSNAGPSAGLLWHVNLGTPATVPSPFIGFRYGPDHDTTPYVGIPGTPVIDLASKTMYLDSFTNDVVGQDAYSHHIHALDITTGQDKVTPVLVQATVNGNGVGGNGSVVPFAADRQIQRAALTLYNGVLYVGYAAYADTDPYHGWLLGFNPSTLAMVSVMNTTPNIDPVQPDNAEGEGGIWGSGAGPASDGSHLYVETGNGDFNASVGDYSDSVLQVTPDASTPASPNLNGYGLSVTDYFTPYNEQALADADADLGSGGSMVLPDQTGTYPHELIAVGKQGFVYLINRDNMGTHTTTVDNVIQTVNLGNGMWGSPAYFNGSVYYHAVDDVLKRYSLTNGMLSAAPAAQSNVVYPTWPNPTPTVSANGTANGIVWDVQYDGSHQVLHAYDATTLAQLYNSSQNAARDQMDAGVKFITPTIADGQVFVGSSDALYIYGLIKPVTTPAGPAPSNLTAEAINSTTVQLNWIDNSDNESGFKIERSTDGTNFTQIDLVGVNSRSYTDTTASPNTPYTYRVRATNAIGNSDYSNTATATTPQTTGAIDLYHFNEGNGTSTADAVSGNNGTLIGSPLPQWVTPGESGAGAALSFSGDGVYNSGNNDSAVQVSSDLSPILGSTSTMDFWVQTTQTGSAYHWQSPAITGADQNGAANDINWGTIDATGRIGLYVGDAGGVYSTNRVNDGQWHNIAMTRNATTGVAQIYVDGVLNATDTLDTGSKTSPFTTIGALTILANDGVTRTGATFFNGKLDELRIYNSVLSGGEINGLAQVPTAPVLSNVIIAAGPVNHLVFSSPSNFATSLEIDRKIGINGTFTAIDTVGGGTTMYDDTNVVAGTSYYYQIKAIDTAGVSAPSNTIGVMPPIPTVIGAYTFYNRSAFDGNNGSSNVTDRSAIASDKQPLLPGHTATFANYTSYSRGLNGIIIEVANMVVLPRIDDFLFRVGNDNNPANWTQAPTPAYINTYPGRGTGGSTQITIIWNDNDIQNEWLQVTVLAQPHLGLASDYTFYFGNEIGDTGDSTTDTNVTSNDANRVSANQTNSATVTNLYDINRDGKVDATDVSLVNANLTGGGTPLSLISLGSAPTVATAANATPNPVTGTTAALSVLGADNTGESNLTYTWVQTGIAPAPVVFSANGTNAAKNTTATFTAAGTYNFTVTISNAANDSVTSNVTVQVNQTATSIALTPAAPTVAANSATSFTASELDQFNNPMAAQPTFTWSVPSGGGSITSSGVYTASRAAGSATVRATADSLVANSTVTVFYDALAWYQADAATGATTLADSSGENQTATLTGSYSLTPGVSGNALTLAGGNANLPTGVVASLNDFTVAAWVNVTTLQAWDRIFDFGTGPNVNMFLTPDAGDTGDIRFAITTAGGGAAEQRVNGPALVANTWTHIAVTLAGNTATLYVNGVAYASNNAVTLHPTNLGTTTQNYLGKSQYAADPALQGSIDDFRIYARALASQEVLALATPTVVTAAAAAPGTVTGTSTTLSTLGADVTAGESALTYTWSTVGTPPAAVNFTPNGTNASKNTTATFAAAGTYNLAVTITNPGGLSTTSPVTVVVTQTASGVGISPSTVTIEQGMTAPFSAGTVDQFGDAMSSGSQPVVAWSVASGGGTVSNSGVYTAPAAAGSASVRATVAGFGPVSANVTIVNSLQVWYQANASSGTTLSDSSGNNHTANLTGSFGFGPGVSGNAVNLTGGNATMPNSIVQGINDFTIAAWVKVTTLANWARIFDFGTGTTVYMFLTPDAGGTNAIRYAITTTGNGAGAEQQLNGPAVTPGVWTHIAVTLSGNTGTLYVNGVAVATNTGMTIHPTNLGATNHDYLGKSQYGADPNLQGSIDDFRLYNRALPAAQVAELADPTVVNFAAAAPAPVTGKSTTLSTLGFDVTTGEPSLTYTWATTGTPPAPVAFSANGTNAAKNTTATFTAAGTYNFTVTITNTGGGTTTSSLTVVVNPTLTNITVSPSSPTMNDGATQAFTASGFDQFGAAMSIAPTWTVDNGGVGSVDATGFYTAPASGPGSATVRATSGSVSGSATVSVTLSNIAGTAGDDTIRLVRSGSSLAVYINNPNTPAYSLPFAALGALTVNGGGGNDTINIDFSGGATPVPAAGLTVDGAAGAADSLILTGTSGNDTATAAATSIVFNGSTITYANLESITVNAGAGSDSLTQSAQPGNGAALTFNGNGGGDTLNINGGSYAFPTDAGTNSPGLIVNVANNGSGVSFTGAQHLATLSISSGASAAMVGVASAASPSVMNVTTLSITGSGSSFDLNNNELITTATLAAVSSMIVADQLISSATGGVLGSMDFGNGQSEARFTLLGDTNLDGIVNVSDLANLAGNFGKTAGQFWINGDLDYNGSVNVADLADLAGNFGNSLGGAATAAASMAVSPSLSAARPATAAVQPLAIDGPSLMSLPTGSCVFCDLQPILFDSLRHRSSDRGYRPLAR
jgi:hypothetical protein